MKRYLKIAAVVAGLFLLYEIGYGVYIFSEVRALRDPSASMTITVLDWQKRPHAFVVGPKNPSYTPWNRIGQYIKWSVIYAEDDQFYHHGGVDFKAMQNAMKKNLEMGRYVRGGSTITQQVAKNLFLSREKTLTRKAKELVIAYLLESQLTKTRILELYLNIVELGPMVYGVGHGSRFYFHKPASALNPLEGAMLASLLPGPKVLDPFRNLDKAGDRAKRVLAKLRQAGVIGEDAFELYRNADLSLGMSRSITIREREIETLPFAGISSTRGMEPATVFRGHTSKSARTEASP